MTIKKYDISIPDNDIWVVVSIDTDIITEELAEEINNFWTSANEILDASDDDIYQAVARRASQNFFISLLNGYNEYSAHEELCEAEGWPPETKEGIKLISYAIPDFSAYYFDVRELD